MKAEGPAENRRACNEPFGGKMTVGVAKPLISAALILFILYAVVCIAVFVKQGRFVYFPSRGIIAEPSDFGLSYEPVRLKTADGVRLSAWWIPAQHARGGLIFCHGNGANMSYWLEKVRYLHDCGLSVLIFDYRGYGASEGRPTEEGTYLDMKAAVQWMERKAGIEKKRLIYYGESLGGAVTAHAGAEDSPAAVVLESTFTNIADMAHAHYRFLPVRFLVRFRYDTLEAVQSLSCPILILHSRGDEIVPFKMAIRLKEAAGAGATLVETRGDHNFGGLLRSREAQEQFKSFLDRVFPPVSQCGDPSSGGRPDSNTPRDSARIERG